MSRFLRPLLSSFLLLGLLSELTTGAEILPIPPQAVKRVSTVQVRVSPDHRDWSYKPGEAVQFRVFVTADNEALEVPVSYTVGPEMMPAPTQQTTSTTNGLLIDGGTMQNPGFLRCTVETEIAGQKYKGVATAAFSPELIVPTQVEPTDFDAFWKAGKEELAAIPMEAKLTLLPDACTASVNVYLVSFRTTGHSWQAPARLFGILCEPKAPGQYPALLRVPGAGVRPYTGDIDFASKGCITLEIGVHGIPVNMAKEVYDVLFSSGLRDYWTTNLDNKDTYYYRRIILGCLRANDFLTSRPAWNGKQLVVAGASQGGFLSLSTAALDSRVTGLSVTHPALCDLTGPLHGRAGGWPHPFRPEASGKPAFHATPEKIATSAYYDGVNFAKRIKVPGFYIWGYNDDVCPPTSTYSAYNVVTAPKELALALEMAHTYSAEQYIAVSTWLNQSLGVK